MSYDDLSDEQLLAKLRRATLERALSLLGSGSEEIPPGQLLGLVGKVGLKDDDPGEVKDERLGQDIFEFLPGLPEERQKEILAEYQAKLDKAKEKHGK